jgi:Tfp pilus assembly protein PilV
MPMNLCRVKKSGLSMVEMMFAMLVLFMVGVFVMDMFVGGSRQMVKASKNEKMNSLLRAKVSEWRLLDFALLDPTPKNGSFPAPDDEFLYAVEFSDFEGLDQSEARTVAVTVSHTEGGQMVSRFSRSRVPALHPGQRAFDKFGCASCHSVPSAGYPDYSKAVPLDNIGSSGAPRPFQTDPSISLEDYVIESMTNPSSFLAFPVEDTLGPMLELNYDESDPNFDPDVDVSAEELSDMATWIEELNNPPSP